MSDVAELLHIESGRLAVSYLNLSFSSTSFVWPTFYSYDVEEVIRYTSPMAMEEPAKKKNINIATTKQGEYLCRFVDSRRS